MSVEDWAREQARENRPFKITPAEATVWEWGHFEGIVEAFSALLSDEAITAAAEAQRMHPRQFPGDPCACGEWFGSGQDETDKWEIHVMRAALQAAVDAVTKGDTE
jgi:hypothetical protein